MWDDHDMGCNNADKTFNKKQAVREYYMDFIEEPQGSPRRLDRDHGIYQDYVIKSTDGVKVHIILLDVRYEFDPDTKDRYGES